MSSSSLLPNADQLVQALEKASADKAAVVNEHASLWARYGPGGTAEKLAASSLETIKARLRKKYLAAGEQAPAETRIESEAKASKVWIQLVEQFTADRERYIRGKAQVDHISDRTRLLLAQLKFLGLAIGTSAGEPPDEGNDEVE